MRNTGWFLFLVLMVAGLVGMSTTGATLYVRLVYLGAFILFSTWAWTRISLQRLKLVRRARSLRASVGDVFEESFELVNPSRLPRLFVEIRNGSNLPSAAGSRLLTWIGARENRTYLARTWLTRRGAFPLGPTTIESGDPFGFFYKEVTFPASASLLVLPLIIPIAEFPSPAGFLPGGKAIQLKSMDVTPHASGVREYVHGDALKRIHWPSTARRGKMMVKEFEQDPQSELWIFLDAQRTVQAALPYEPPKVKDNWIFSRRPEIQLPPSTLEYGVSLAASLAHYYIAQRRAVGFVTDGPVYTVIPAERSERQESKVLENLAFVTGEGTLPLASLVDLQAPQMPLGSSALLISSSVQKDVELAAELLQRRKLRPIMLLLMAHSFGGQTGSEELADSLESRGVPVCRIYNNANLGEALAGFAAQNRQQEARSWYAHPSTLST
ncbi:MAG TPA: DUF58 domain-containing protein [Anaerolineales bacterium]|jgi:uncharacterized protein (DUF58 family)